MAKLKMGMHNRVTERRFYTIKGALNKGMGNAKAMAKFKVGDSTIRKIRRCKNFREYRLENHAKHVEIKVVAPGSGLLFEDYPPKQLHPMSDQLDREAELTARHFGICLLGIMVIAAISIIAIVIGS